MSTTNFPQNDALAVKLWARVLETEALKYTAIRPLIGTDENSVIHLQNALSKGPGDQITYAIVMQLAQAGFTENQLAEGNGEALTTYSDSLVINELMGVVGVKSRRTIDQQRIPWDLRDTAKGRLRDWWTDEDREAFEKRTQSLVDQYNRLSPAEVPDVHVNGKLTLGENIADIGGVKMAFKAYRSLRKDAAGCGGWHIRRADGVDDDVLATMALPTAEDLARTQSALDAQAAAPSSWMR